ncbi:MAG: hypothetical protein HC845_01485 [Akkermansiaceae bacterium]|nr:hypothetical protein [Akkermansiaceae bacterium]
MDLILLRHGKAEDQNPQGDFFRELTEKGRDQSRRAAHLIKSAGKLPEVILTSPLIRARQTADEFSRTAEMPGAITQSWLACGMHPEIALKELAGFPEFKRIMIVGHEPDFSHLLQWILGVGDGRIQVKKGAIACIQIFPPSRHGKLKFLIPPKLVDEAEPEWR